MKTGRQFTRQILCFVVLMSSILPIYAQQKFEIRIVAIDENRDPLLGVAIRPNISDKIYFTDSTGVLQMNFPEGNNGFSYDTYKKGYAKWPFGSVSKKNGQVAIDTVLLIQREKPLLSKGFDSSLTGLTLRQVVEKLDMIEWDYAGTGDPPGIINEVQILTDDSVQVTLPTQRYYFLDEPDRDAAILNVIIEAVILDFPDCTQIRFPKAEGKYHSWVWSPNPYCKEKDH